MGRVKQSGFGADGRLDGWEISQQDGQIQFHVVQSYTQVVEHGLPIFQVADGLLYVLSRQARDVFDSFLPFGQFGIRDAFQLNPVMNQTILP